MKYDTRYTSNTRDAYLTARDACRDICRELGAHYRITRTGEVHFYGRMPNSTSLGWYLGAIHWSELDAVK